jgi:putative aldouronate transport system substrate-binding protein
LINTDVKLYNTMCYGIEGKHFVLKDGMRAFPEGVTAATSTYNPDVAWAYGNSFNAYLAVGSDPEVLKKQLEYDQAAFPEPAFGFMFDETPVTTELTQINSVIAEYCTPMETGSVDYEVYYPQFIQKLKEAGLEKVVAEKQKQLDAFLASQKN